MNRFAEGFFCLRRIQVSEREAEFGRLALRCDNPPEPSALRGLDLCSYVKHRALAATSEAGESQS